MRIGLLLDSLDNLPRVGEWGHEYVEIVPWLLGPDADDAAATREAAQRILKSPVPVTMAASARPGAARARWSSGPDVNWPRLRTYVTRVFDRMRGVAN